jgi:hypothetical protein
MIRRRSFVLAQLNSCRSIGLIVRIPAEASLSLALRFIRAASAQALLRQLDKSERWESCMKIMPSALAAALVSSANYGFAAEAKTFKTNIFMCRKTGHSRQNFRCRNLASAATRPVFSSDGSALVIHQAADDYHTNRGGKRR